MTGLLGKISDFATGAGDIKTLGRNQKRVVKKQSAITQQALRKQFDLMRGVDTKNGKPVKSGRGISDVANVNRTTAQDLANSGIGYAGLSRDALQNAVTGGADALRTGENTALGYSQTGLKQAYDASRKGIDQFSRGIAGGLGTQRQEMLSGYGQQLSALDRMKVQAQNMAGNGIDTYQNNFSDISQRLNPYMQGGEDAQQALLNASGLGKGGYSDFYKSPDYNFRMDEGTKALERSAAAQGGLYSGETGKALQKFGQGLAKDSFNDYTNRLSGIANQGQNAATNYGQFGQNTAQGVAGIYGDYADGQERFGNTGLGILGNRSTDTQANTMAQTQNTAQRNLNLADLMAKYGMDVNKNRSMNAQKRASIGSEEQGKLGTIGSNYQNTLGGIDAQKIGTIGNLTANELQNLLANQLNYTQQKADTQVAMHGALGGISSDTFKGVSGANRGMIGNLIGIGGAAAGMPGLGQLFGNPYGQPQEEQNPFEAISDGIAGLFGGKQPQQPNYAASPMTPGYGIGAYGIGGYGGYGGQPIPVNNFQAGYL